MARIVRRAAGSPAHAPVASAGATLPRSRDRSRSSLAMARAAGVDVEAPPGATAPADDHLPRAGPDRRPHRRRSPRRLRPPRSPTGCRRPSMTTSPAASFPLDELVPRGDEVTGVDHSRGPPTGEAVVIVFATPGADPFAQARGFVVWRRDAGGEPPWRAVYGLAHGRRDGVLAISADTTDLTGGRVDRRPDPRGDRRQRGVRHLPGDRPERGGCHLEARRLRRRDPAEPRIRSASTRSRAVYGPDDPHCCPSAIRERVLTWNGTRFVVASEEMTKL